MVRDCQAAHNAILDRADPRHDGTFRERPFLAVVLPGDDDPRPCAIGRSAWQAVGVRTGGLRFSADVSVASWIAPRLGGEFGAVTRTVPQGFAA